ncbi:MAG: prepilin-type N-terminal cleavage/methylation domain-containing protein, partial [Kiritimatiellae bacterium]|nr:prepilin-type N-terminal cleavage/methylation domain-containing protein [Kiritimatiellia bacterium]
MRNTTIRAQRKARRGKLGLTLIEVLMALAIMGIGLAGLVAAASRCLAVARKAKNYENTRRLLGEAEMKWQEYLLEREEDEPLAADTESWS